MIRKIAAALLAVALAACASNPKTFTGQFERPPAGSRVLVMTPDVQLAMLNASGVQEARQDWSEAGRDNIASAVEGIVTTHGHRYAALDPATAMTGRVGQIIRLHEAVGTSIMMANFLPASLPTHRDTFEWTLGPGVQSLRDAHGADYALFITARGSYASGGRVAMAVLFGTPLGGQSAIASLVDLDTGNVIWFNNVVAAPGEDMRSPEGAASLARRIMDEAPL